MEIITFLPPFLYFGYGIVTSIVLIISVIVWLYIRFEKYAMPTKVAEESVPTVRVAFENTGEGGKFQSVIDGVLRLISWEDLLKDISNHVAEALMKGDAQNYLSKIKLHSLELLKLEPLLSDWQLEVSEDSRSMSVSASLSVACMVSLGLSGGVRMALPVPGGSGRKSGPRISAVLPVESKLTLSGIEAHIQAQVTPEYVEVSFRGPPSLDMSTHLVIGGKRKLRNPAKVERFLSSAMEGLIAKSVNRGIRFGVSPEMAQVFSVLLPNDGTRAASSSSDELSSDSSLFALSADTVHSDAEIRERLLQLPGAIDAPNLSSVHLRLILDPNVSLLGSVGLPTAHSGRARSGSGARRLRSRARRLHLNRGPDSGGGASGGGFDAEADEAATGQEHSVADEQVLEPLQASPPSMADQRDKETQLSAALVKVSPASNGKPQIDLPRGLKLLPWLLAVSSGGGEIVSRPSTPPAAKRLRAASAAGRLGGSPWHHAGEPSGFRLRTWENQGDRSQDFGFT